MSGDIQTLGTYRGEEKLVFCLDIGTTNCRLPIQQVDLDQALTALVSGGIDLIPC